MPIHKFTFKINSKKSLSGFSLLEVMTVLFIVSIGMIGTLALIIQNIQTEKINQGDLIACQLAQEGIELVREVRDNNWRAGVGWLTTLDDGDYRMDYSMDTPRAITTTDEGLLYLNNGFYNHEAADEGDHSTETKFYRVLNLQNSTTETDIEQVKSTVSWSERGKNHNCSLETMLYNWR